MRRTTTIAAVAAVLLAAPIADAALTGGSLKLQIDTVTGQAYLVSTVAEAIPLKAYYIRNVAGMATLIPDTETFDFSHWVGIGTYFNTGHSADLVPAVLSSANGWSLIINTTSYLGEGRITGVSNLVGYGYIPIGSVTTSTQVSDFVAASANKIVGEFTWQYKIGSNPTVTVDGPIEFVPEPATMTLLALGGLAVIRKRRK
ncbi:MAG: PEP-CTERM sorting domain-containing protein [Planctomycetota bacterium]|nr:PEP-CTERM sorting domain-containing protein [Planctomycetota bacterium]